MADIKEQDSGCYTEHGVSGYGVAAKLSRNEAMDDAFVKTMAEKTMLSIAQECLDMGAKCIGHIKSHLKTEVGTIKSDTIGIAHGAYSTGQITQPVKSLYIAINSIVQGIPEDGVKTATLKGLHEVTEKYNITVVKEKEHAYFDEFDFTAGKQDYIKQLEEQLKADNLENVEEGN